MGLSRELFWITEEIYDVRCMICLDVLDEPRRMSNCRHHYCLDCITEWLRDADRCPQCQMEGESAQPSASILEQIRNLPTKCYYHSMGCNRKIPFGHMETHMFECIYRVTHCPRGCGGMIPLVDVPTHLLTCPLGPDPLLLGMMCFRCRHLYAVGCNPTHCGYYMLARNVWVHNHRRRPGNSGSAAGSDQPGSSSTSTPGQTSTPQWRTKKWRTKKWRTKKWRTKKGSSNDQGGEPFGNDHGQQCRLRQYTDAQGHGVRNITYCN